MWVFLEEPEAQETRRIPLDPVDTGKPLEEPEGRLCLKGERQELNFGVGSPLVCRLIGRRSLFGEGGRFRLVLRHHLLGDELGKEGAGVSSEPAEVSGVGTRAVAFRSGLVIAVRAVCCATSSKSLGAPV